jgi:hypothetical protein
MHKNLKITFFKINVRKKKFSYCDPGRKVHHVGKRIGVRNSHVVEAAKIPTRLTGPCPASCPDEEEMPRACWTGG